jgi:hypothetical protein
LVGNAEKFYFVYVLEMHTEPLYVVHNYNNYNNNNDDNNNDDNNNDDNDNDDKHAHAGTAE